MSVYLHDIPLDQAQKRLLEALVEAGLDGVLAHEEIPLDEYAIGRVLAEPVWARISSPHYHAAAMDGFALRAQDSVGAALNAPLELEVGEKAAYVDTGDPLPSWANAVVPIEETEPEFEGTENDIRHPRAIRIRAALPPWKHVRPMGEDMVATELVLPQGHTLRPVDLGACAGSGNHSVVVSRKPRVILIPTGTELKPVGEPVGAGDIIEYNSIVLAAQVRQWGGEAIRMPITPDDIDQITQTVKEALKTADLVLLLSGSSAGAEDFSAGVVEALGQLLVHGVAVRPGHPVILGMAGETRKAPIIGVPGYPVSAALTGEVFIEPMLARWSGRRPHEPQTINAEMARKITSPLGDDDFVRVAVAKVGERILAAPISRGAGVISSLVRADGIVVVPNGTQGYASGEQVKVRLYRTTAEIDRTILVTGSHDVALDVLAQFLALRQRRLASTNVGSLGGLLALGRHEAHLAGSHLLDPETGKYNLAYIRKYIPGEEVIVIAFVGREQGLLVPSHNPKGIRTLEDLMRSDVRFVNRQRGAGTRVLFDHEIEKIGISSDKIRGYEQEEYTHLAVAAAIASGRADCGMGIPAAARAVGLDFIPLSQERYDLVVPAEHYNSNLLAPLFEVLEDEAFKNSVSRLPGYDISPMGQVIGKLG
jgi:putative molybdopterin biosynthesis protein